MAGAGTVLADRHVMNMLLFLLDNGRVKESQLTAVVKNYYSAVDVASKLVSNGLALTWTEKDGHTVRIYELTDLGKDVAMDLKRANDRLNGIIPESDQPNHGAPEAEGSGARS